MYALQMWGEFGGSGVTIGLVIAIMIFGKREDNKAIATLSLVQDYSTSMKQLHLVFQWY